MSGLDAAGGGGGDGSGDGGSLVAQHRASFAQEVEVLGRCNHPNVVRLLAANLRQAFITGVSEYPSTISPASAACPEPFARLLKTLAASPPARAWW